LIPVIFYFGVTSRSKNGCRRGGGVSGASGTSNSGVMIAHSFEAPQIRTRTIIYDPKVSLSKTLK